MPTTKKLDALKINKLTEAQLATATINEDEIYLVTDAKNPVDVKTDASLTGNGSSASPLSVSPNITATTISASSEGTNAGHMWFETPKGVSTWHMYDKIFEPIWVGEGNTSGQIGRSGATLAAVYAAKLCKDNTELSVRDGTSGDIAVTSELPEAKTGTAGQVYTKTESGAEWKDATGGGSSLPDQTGNAGKFLTTDGTTTSWGQTLPYTEYDVDSIVAGFTESGYMYRTTAFGKGIALPSGASSVTAFGSNMPFISNGTVAIGCDIICSGASNVIIGAAHLSAGVGSCIAIGNRSDGTEFGESDSVIFSIYDKSYKLLDFTDGTIPAARHAPLPTENGTYVLKATVVDGVVTTQWVAEA